MNDRIQCLECGKFFAFLPVHIVRAHHMDCDDYREKHGLARGYPLASEEYRARCSERMKESGIGHKMKHLLPMAAANKGGYKQRRAVRNARADHYQQLSVAGRAVSHSLDKTSDRIQLAGPWPATTEQIRDRIGCTKQAAATFVSYCVKKGRLRRVARGLYDRAVLVGDYNA